MLALIAGYRLVVVRQPIDFLTAGLVVVAAVAAIAHRNAVGGLEARGRGEAESFARILRGLSRSVSADAIVAAILDDLIDATAADHVVLVRRRPEARSLEARLVTRRPGIPTTATMLPVSLLDPTPSLSVDSVGVPVGPGRPGADADAEAPTRIHSLTPQERLRIFAPQANAPEPGHEGAAEAVAADVDPAIAEPAAPDAGEQLTLAIEPEEPPRRSCQASHGLPGARPIRAAAGRWCDASPPSPSPCSRTSGCRRRTCSGPAARPSRSRSSRVGPRPRSSSGSPIASSPPSACRTRSRRHFVPRARSSARSSSRVARHTPGRRARDACSEAPPARRRPRSSAPSRTARRPPGPPPTR